MKQYIFAAMGNKKEEKSIRVTAFSMLIVSRNKYEAMGKADRLSKQELPEESGYYSRFTTEPRDVSKLSIKFVNDITKDMRDRTLAEAEQIASTKGKNAVSELLGIIRNLCEGVDEAITEE